MQLKSTQTIYIAIVVGVFVCLNGAIANAMNMNTETIFLSAAANNETLGGLTFQDDDVIAYDPHTDVANPFFDGGALFTANNEDVNAVSLLNDGTILLSTTNTATLGGLTFRDGDIVHYNPLTDIATLFFDEDLFSADENVDGLTLLNGGNFLLSTTNNATLGGLTFSDGDIVEYDPLTDVATLFFDEDLFSGNEDIDAISLLSNGNIVLSIASGNGATLGGLTFRNGDLAEYNPVTDIATLFFNEDLFSNSANINAVHILEAPEPITAALSLISLATLGMAMRRRVA